MHPTPIETATIGAIVAAMGVLTGALLSGRELDTELIAIVALASVGGWLLVTALLSSRRPTSGAWAQPSPAYAAGLPTVASAGGDDFELPETPETPLTAAARTAASKAQRTSKEDGGADAS